MSTSNPLLEHLTALVAKGANTEFEKSILDMVHECEATAYHDGYERGQRDAAFERLSAEAEAEAAEKAAAPAPDAELERLLGGLEEAAVAEWQADGRGDESAWECRREETEDARNRIREHVQRREAAARGALENVKLLAVRRRRTGFQPGDADHLLRFCAEAGVVPNPLRAAHPEG